MIDEMGGVTRFFYDANSNLTAVVNPGKARTEYQYDRLDRVVISTDLGGSPLRCDWEDRPTSVSYVTLRHWGTNPDGTPMEGRFYFDKEELCPPV